MFEYINSIKFVGLRVCTAKVVTGMAVFGATLTSISQSNRNTTRR